MFRFFGTENTICKYECAALYSWNICSAWFTRSCLWRIHADPLSLSVSANITYEYNYPYSTYEYIRHIHIRIMYVEMQNILLHARTEQTAHSVIITWVVAQAAAKKTNKVIWLSHSGTWLLEMWMCNGRLWSILVYALCVWRCVWFNWKFYLSRQRQQNGLVSACCDTAHTFTDSVTHKHNRMHIWTFNILVHMKENDVACILMSDRVTWSLSAIASACFFLWFIVWMNLTVMLCMWHYCLMLPLIPHQQ